MYLRRIEIFSLYQVKAFLLVSIIISSSSCKKFLVVEPPSSKITYDLVFSNDNMVDAALAGIYLKLYGNSSFASGGAASIASLAGLSSDELHNNSLEVSPGIISFEENELKPDNLNIENLWKSMYQTIYQANAILEGLSKSTEVTIIKKNRSRGEALFVRAFCHFYLLNLFGDVPVITTTDYNVNKQVPRLPESLVYNQIETDLIEAETLLGDDYITPRRVRPNKYAAVAFLARVYLYQKKWVDAEANSTKIINQSSVFHLVENLNNVFLYNSQEAIWQLMPPDGVSYTNEGYIFSNRFGPGNNILTDRFLESFSINDRRRSEWINPLGLVSLPFKYKLYLPTSQPSTEYSMVFRLAEQYLIRAEARAQLGNIVGAQSAMTDINLIRQRANLTKVSAVSLNEAMAIIEQERKVELFTEWGHRWFDLKRWDRLNQVLTQLKPKWNSTDILYPIPQSELKKNPNLTPQNYGY